MMPDPPDRVAPRRETPLEEGLRRFAPGPGDGRRIAIGDVIVSLLLTGSRRQPRRDA